MDAKVFWNIRDWADAVAQMPVQGPLPCRTVLVPRERVAHVLRRELIRSRRHDALAGTRFLPTAFAAIEVLRSSGSAFEVGEEALRAARLLVLFRSDLRLGHFKLDLVRSNPGWDEAFAHTISDLEGAGLRPADLESPGASAPLRDVAAVWRALDDSAGSSWTIQRIYSESAASLERDPGGWPFQGSVLATAGGMPDGRRGAVSPLDPESHDRAARGTAPAGTLSRPHGSVAREGSRRRASICDGAALAVERARSSRVLPLRASGGPRRPEAPTQRRTR